MAEILAFVQWLQVFTLERRATLITLCRGHSSRELNSRYKDDMELDNSNDVIVAFLDHTSHLTVVVWPLTTGHSEVVTGNFLFGWNSTVVPSAVSSNVIGRYQYNIEDKNVKVFALGASSAVL